MEEFWGLHDKPVNMFTVYYLNIFKQPRRARINTKCHPSIKVFGHDAAFQESDGYAKRPNWRKRYRRVLPFDEVRGYGGFLMAAMVGDEQMNL